MSSEVLGPGTLAGINAVVTGTSSGIGRAVAARLVGLGAVVHGLDRARDLADEARGRVQERLDGLPADTSVLAELVATIRDRRA